MPDRTQPWPAAHQWPGQGPVPPAPVQGSTGSAAPYGPNGPTAQGGPVDPWGSASLTYPYGYGPAGEPPPTVDFAEPPQTVPDNLGFRRGVAQVGRAAVRPTAPRSRSEDALPSTQPWETAPDVRAPREPMSAHVRQLRRGGEWTSVGVLFAFVCWGIWAISSRDGDLSGPVLAFILVLIVSGGVFALARLVGRVFLERSLGRVRRSAWGAHLVTGLFLGAAGIAYLGQTPWVVDAWTWVKSLFW